METVAIATAKRIVWFDAGFAPTLDSGCCSALGRSMLFAAVMDISTVWLAVSPMDYGAVPPLRQPARLPVELLSPSWIDALKGRIQKSIRRGTMSALPRVE